jgi:asparagine synthase (glutamine-hydrolysing)
MCGFVGIWKFRSPLEQRDREWVAQGLEDMRYRGPDESRVVEEGGLLLGFNRLAIRDLSTAGSQPMRSASGHSLMLYNGETYNTQALVQAAGLEGHQFRGGSDTEVLLEVAEKKGVPWMLERADGIFALAWFDVKQQQLFLGRDHLGVKPLYVGWTDELICFGSEYNAVVKHPALAGNLIQAGPLQNYLRFGFIQEGEGLLENTLFLPHKHFLEISNSGGQVLEKYDGDAYHRPATEAPLEQVIAQAVQLQLASDVPLGTFLSSGIDSTLVTAMAKEEKPNIQAFTVGVDDPEMDETAAAARIAQQLGVQHVVGRATTTHSTQLLHDYVQSMGESLGDFSSLVTLEVCRLAKQQMTVVLSGDGGDELFFGYPRFKRIPQAHGFFSKSLVGRLCLFGIKRLTAQPIPREWLKYPNFGEYYLKVQGQMGADQWAPALIQGPWNPPLPPILQGLNFKPTHTVEAAQLARTLEKRIHLQRVLLKVDRASMFHSVEVRTPLLSRSVEMASESYQLHNCIDSSGRGKWPLRSMALKKTGLKEVSGAAKRGFTLPLAQWLRQDLKELVGARLQVIPLRLQPIFNPDAIQRMWHEHQTGQDHSWMIWNVYSLFAWADRNMRAT